MDVALNNCTTQLNDFILNESVFWLIVVILGGLWFFTPNKSKDTDNDRPTPRRRYTPEQYGNRDADDHWRWINLGDGLK